jgi:DNA invertase Pin-like site-specific DNA recombinase
VVNQRAAETTPEGILAGIYCRLSKAPDGSVENVERQEAMCRATAARHGWDVAAVYVDNGKSAWRRGVRRPAWEQMLTDITSGRLNAIVSYHGDRLMRQPRDLEALLDIADKRHLQLASATGKRDLSNGDDRLVLRIETAAACHQSDSTSRRVKDAAMAAAHKGHPHPGRFRCFGYEKDGVTVVPGEAEVIRAMAGKVCAGESLRSIARWLADTKVPTVTGAQWTRSTVRSVLTNPRIAGKRAVHREPVADGNWAPILAHQDWEELKLALTPLKRGPNAGPPTARVYLLSGIAECASCHEKVVGHRRHDRPGVTVYYCINQDCPGPKVTRQASHLDAYVTGTVLALLSDERFIESLHATTSEAGAGIRAEIAGLERRKAHALEVARSMADHPEIDPADLWASIVSYDKRIASLRERLPGSSRSSRLRRHAGITLAQWKAFPLDVRRAIIAAAYRITIKPSSHRGPGFNPGDIGMRLRED